MQRFPSTFFLFFYQIALGGLFGLAATPFHEIDRAFYKSTGAVLFVIAALGLWGKSRIYLESISNGMTLPMVAEALVHILFVVFFASYLISLWEENQRFRANCFAASLLTGFAGLLFIAHGSYHAPFFSAETGIYPIAFFLSSLLLGSVTVGMLIGHWYLIDAGQSLSPFLRLYKFFLIALIAQTAFTLLALIVLYLAGTPATLEAINRMWRDHRTLLLTRIFIGQIAPLGLAVMIWRTLKIPHTMAATGLFYIALLGVFVGEILARQILALTSLPF